MSYSVRDGGALSYSSFDPDFLTVIASFVISMHTPSIPCSYNDVNVVVFGWVRMLLTPASTLPQARHPSTSPQ